MHAFDFTGRTALVTGAGSAERVRFAAARFVVRLGARVYLASEPASFVTGQSIVIDGGSVIEEPHGVDLYGAA
jgi:NAD(P)-dependent dehydrogenase (short-subunit alcohol dehydrogenase family)